MAMGSMGPDCPMTGMNTVGASDCHQNCCTRLFAQVLTPLAAPEKLRLIALTSFAVLPAAAFEPKPGFSALAPIEAQIASPPRYILIQVFRI
jgi:hypothetical protein